jgi:hypothetical protein
VNCMYGPSTKTFVHEETLLFANESVRLIHRTKMKLWRPDFCSNRPRTISYKNEGRHFRLESCGNRNDDECYLWFEVEPDEEDKK